jgi:hypothetical protein
MAAAPEPGTSAPLAAAAGGPAPWAEAERRRHRRALDESEAVIDALEAEPGGEARRSKRQALAIEEDALAKAADIHAAAAAAQIAAEERQPRAPAAGARAGEPHTPAGAQPAQGAPQS